MRATFTVQALRLAVILGLVGCLASATWAQAPTAESGAAAVAKKVSKPVPAAAPRTAAKPSSGTQEGIKVHGDWTIVIRNEDGSVASRHKFRNALANFGVLPQLLAHGGSVGRWQVHVGGIGTEPCSLPNPLSGGSLPFQCILSEQTGGQFGALQVTASSTDLTIQGSVKAVNATQLGAVFTAFDVCPPAQTPSAACVGNTASFTSKDITSLNIQVAANQTIDVTVRISFS